MRTVLRKFLAVCFLLGIFSGGFSVLFAGEQPDVAWNGESGQARLTTGNVELLIDTKAGLNAHSLKNVQSGEVYADRDYCWPNGKLPTLSKSPTITKEPGGSVSITFAAKLDVIEVEQTFTAPAGEPGVILESITIRNPTDAAVATADFKCGLTKCVRDGEVFAKDAEEVHFCPIPYRRETNGQMQEFPLREVVEHGIVVHGLDGAGGADADLGRGRLGVDEGIIRFPDREIQSRLDGMVADGAGETRQRRHVVRFGGAGQWKHDHPEGSAKLEPASPTVSAKRGSRRSTAIGSRPTTPIAATSTAKGCDAEELQSAGAVERTLRQRVFRQGLRAWATSISVRRKPGFCPEYYEKNKKLLNEYYSLDLMKGEAAKAKELGCEALYLDPGWETGPSRQIWDAERLGSMPSFVKMIREQYGMRGVCFWCSLAGVPPTIGDPSACPKEARVLDKEGKPAEFLLVPSFAGIPGHERTRTCSNCAKNGALFFMFDSNQYSGPCYDKTHGHSIPSTREEHAKALFELARRVKVKYPNVLIEMHDPITGPCNIHYTPSYFGYNPPNSFDCLWGHEFMWNSMDDLLSRQGGQPVLLQSGLQHSALSPRRV